MMLRSIAFLLLLLSALVSSRAEEASVWIHIPVDLHGCFSALDTLLSLEDVAAIRSGTEEEMLRYHFSLGMWIRNNWGLWDGSQLAGWFHSLGIHHPDDMSSIILDSYWRHLNDEPIQLKQQVKSYLDYWERLHREQGAE